MFCVHNEKLDNYDVDIKNSRDPSLLLEAFELTHSTKFLSNATIMMLNVEDQYAALKQNSNESLIPFKKRIEQTLCMDDDISVASNCCLQHESAPRKVW